MREKQRHKTAAIIGTVTPVPHYPKKLKVYLTNASPFWQAVYWERGKTYRKSTKTTDKLEAFKTAIVFYEQILLAKYSHPSHVESLPISLPASTTLTSSKAKKTFLETYEEWFELKSSKWKQAHTRNVRNRIEKYLLKDLAAKPIKAITQTELLSSLKKLDKKGITHTQHRLLRDCKSIWQYAIATGNCNRDITLNLTIALKSPVYGQQHAVSAEELPMLMSKITAEQTLNDKIKCLALEVIAHTFVRTSELLGATWSEIDFENRVWLIPARRMKMGVEHIVPLSNHVISLLIYIREDFSKSDYVFNRLNSTQKLAPDSLIKMLHKLGYKKRMSTHGFRAIASSVLNEHGFNADAIERQLSHLERNRVRRAYNRAQYLSERKDMMNWWSQYLLDCYSSTTKQKY
ncbi:site-specific integrase [Methylophaga sp.]|uniref:tyrosine-type recombinase/integrase n=1 Tax=Methylophaga sp. TaxID=2024840 RepID=UPI0013FEBDC3|nr:site-specific integrase [Methylophaga sp.]MTI64187.1 integrase [Methylophaga sp.]